MSYTIAELLKTAQSCGLAHNSGAGGQYLLCATEAQLIAYAAALAQPDALTRAAEQFLASCKDGNAAEMIDYYQEIFSAAIQGTT